MIQPRRLKDGSLRYDVRVGDGPRRTFTRRADAEEYEAEQRRNRRRASAGLEYAKADITFDQLVELWKGAFSPSPWRLDMIAYATDRWGSAMVRTIQPEQLGPWISNLKGRKEKPLSQKTRSHILETMRQVLNAGVEWGYLTKSPARRGMFKVPSRMARVRPIRPFESWTEVERVADASAKQYYMNAAVVLFACSTGLRPNEWLDLRWTDIDLKNKSMRVGSKTSAGHRTVPLCQQARDALIFLPRSLSGYVFTSRRGTRFNYRRWRRVEWPAALALAGLEHRTPYEMRHTFATLALAHGASIDDVATVMGHEDITVAFNYYRKWIRAMADRLRLTLDQIGVANGQDEAHASGEHQ